MSASRWTHLVCGACWVKRNPDGRTPGRIPDDETDACCDCGQQTDSGIYIRADPYLTACKGEGGTHVDEPLVKEALRAHES